MPRANIVITIHEEIEYFQEGIVGEIHDVDRHLPYYIALVSSCCQCAGRCVKDVREIFRRVQQRALARTISEYVNRPSELQSIFVCNYDRGNKEMVVGLRSGGMLCDEDT